MSAGAGGGAADPTRISQSDFEGFTANGTYSTWTYNGLAATGGNVLTLASPGSNTFKEHNTTKSGGFLGHSFIQQSNNGYGFVGFAIFETSTGAEASEGYLETVTNTYTIFRKHPADYTFFYTYSSVNSNNATGTQARVSCHYGTGSGYVEDYSNTFDVAGEFRYHGDSNPFFFRIGRDDDDYVYVQGFYGGGNSAPDYEGTGFTVTDRQYFKNGTGFQTTTDGARQATGGIQFGWGNYDNYHIEVFKHIEFWTNGD